MKEYYNRTYALRQLDLDERGNSFAKIEALWREKKRPMRVLDIGCGAGSVSQKLVQNGHKVYGLDLMEEAVRRAKKRGLIAQVYDLNMLPLPFEDGFFDCVLALDILEHLFSPLAVLREIKRTLQSDGYAIVFLPLHFDIRQRLRILAGKGIILYEHFMYNPACVSWEYFHVRFFTLREVDNFIAAADFFIERRIYRPIVTIDLNWPAKLLLNRHTENFLASHLPSFFASGMNMVIRNLSTAG